LGHFLFNSAATLTVAYTHYLLAMIQIIVIWTTIITVL
jgi:hypothetical protein